MSGSDFSKVALASLPCACVPACAALRHACARIPCPSSEHALSPQPAAAIAPLTSLSLCCALSRHQSGSARAGVAPVAQPANMRVTRQRAARERLALAQQQQLQQEPPSGGEAMAVEPPQFNLDPLTTRDPQLCHHYTKEIYNYLRTLEMEHRVSPHFMQARCA